MAVLSRPPGLISALVGGVLGAAVGVWVGHLASKQLAAGDLSDIGTEIALVLAGLLVGPSAGATFALGPSEARSSSSRIRRRPRVVYWAEA